MKKILFLICAAALLLSGCRSSAPQNVPPIELRQNSAVRIVIPAEHANPGIEVFLKKAASVIQKGFAETLGVKVKVEVEGKNHAFKGTTIFLGNTKAIRGIGIEPLKFENFNAVIAPREITYLLYHFCCTRSISHRSLSMIRIRSSLSIRFRTWLSSKRIWSL